MAKKTEEGGWDSAENEVKSNWVKFNVPMEDKILGTLIAKRQMASSIPGQENKKVWVYELRADEGHYHVLDEMKKVVDEPVEVVAGAFYSVGGTSVIDRQMQNAIVGQKVGFKFIEEKPSKTKGFAPAKVVQVYMPTVPGTKDFQMDEEFLKQKELDTFGN